MTFRNCPANSSEYPTSFAARGVFAVADTVDAMTSDRPYRSALSFEETEEEIRRGSGSRYDSQVANVFLSVGIENWKAMRRSIDRPSATP